MKLGFILASCYFAGAIATELSHDVLKVNPFVPIILLWTGAFIRDRSIFSDMQLSADQRSTSPRTLGVRSRPELLDAITTIQRSLPKLNRRVLTSKVALAATIATLSFAQHRGTVMPTAGAKAGATQGTFTTYDDIPWKPLNPKQPGLQMSVVWGIQTTAPRRSCKSFLRVGTRLALAHRGI